MKPNQHEKAKPNNINVNHIYHDFLYPYICLHYFEKLNLFFFQIYSESALEGDDDRIMVRALERGKDNLLHFQENSQTRQIQRKIIQEYDQGDETTITFDEKTEEIIIYYDIPKICTFKENELQIGMRDYKNMNTLYAFEKYYLGYNENKFYIFRKNNMKIVLRQILRQILKNQYFETQPQSLDLLLVRLFGEVLFYKKSSSRMKIIRKLKLKEYIQRRYYQGRYIAIQENLQLRIIDLTNMKIKQYSNLLKNGSSVWNIYQLGLFLISCKSEDNLINQNSIKLQKDALVQTIKVGEKLRFIKYSKSLGLLVFYDQQ